MPEWPELRVWSNQADHALSGAVLDRIDAENEKVLNMPAAELNALIHGKRVQSVRNHGKWMLMELDEGVLGLNFNMGADFRLSTSAMENTRLQIRFADGRVFSVRFWFLGYLIYARSIEKSPALQRLGPDCMALTRETFCSLLKGKRNLKALLLDQHRMAGIGNFYIHDLLFLSGLHPLRQAGSLSNEEKGRLYDAMHALFDRSVSLGGAFYEKNLFFESGNYRELHVGYRQNELCPRCGNTIVKLKVGSSMCLSAKIASDNCERNKVFMNALFFLPYHHRMIY